jgi:hypothetical protein
LKIALKKLLHHHKMAEGALTLFQCMKLHFGIVGRPFPTGQRFFLEDWHTMAFLYTYYTRTTPGVVYLERESFLSRWFYRWLHLTRGGGIEQD